MTIFLDLDEVLADFLGSFEKQIGEDLSEVDTWNLSKCTNISQEKLDSCLNLQGHYFWANLNKLPKADDLVKSLESYELPIYIVSAPTENPGSWSGKKAWIDKYYPQFSDHIILTRSKHLLAKPDTVLIDDSPYNIFTFRKQGGHAIPYPRLWNIAERYIGKEVEFVTQTLDQNVRTQNSTIM